MSEEKQGCLPAGCGTILVGLAVTGAVLLAIGGKRDSAPPDPAYRDYYAKHTSQAPQSDAVGWWVGGTLHQATVDTWADAAHSNKLATAADYLSATKWKGHVNPESMSRLRAASVKLVDAVDEVVRTYQEQGMGSQQVAEIAAAIIKMANDLGP